ncbi:hypothetical protein GCM10010357_62260 [Streptomyces luteireticuli]|uniref:Uncharacterized protein n=1 Tax=Streptomyces luteireticuli TaxID=173858 RepID=A0ABN0Z4T4_9ACTN
MPGGEVAPDEVRGGRCEPVRDCRAFAAPQMAALDPVEAHEPLDALAVDGMPEAPQFGVDAADSVRSLVLGVDLADLRDQGLAGGPPLRPGLRTGDPPVVTRARDLKDPAYPLNTEGPGVGGDEVPAAGLHFISFAK